MVPGAQPTGGALASLDLDVLPLAHAHRLSPCPPAHAEPTKVGVTGCYPVGDASVIAHLHHVR